jgi:hypothetical protein
MKESRQGFFSSILSLFNKVSTSNTTTSGDIKLRQFIWEEYYAGNDKKQSYINVKTKSTINYWYKRFKSGNISLFDQHDIASVIQKLTNGDEVGLYSLNLTILLE